MSASGKPLQIDIPVKLGEVKTVFSIDALAFEGDLPASLFHLQLIENDITDWNAKAEVIAVFHANAGHVTLNESAYSSDRNVATGATPTRSSSRTCRNAGCVKNCVLPQRRLIRRGRLRA